MSATEAGGCTFGGRIKKLGEFQGRHRTISACCQTDKWMELFTMKKQFLNSKKKKKFRQFQEDYLYSNRHKQWFSECVFSEQSVGKKRTLLFEVL